MASNTATAADRYWAISSLGWGRGATVDEAVDNYVATQLRDHRVKDTRFRTKAEFAEWLRHGSGAPIEWRAPEGTVGFVLGPVPGKGTVPQWEQDDGTYVVAEDEHFLRNPQWPSE